MPWDTINMIFFLFILINFFYSFHITATDLFPGGVVNICNNDIANPNCDQRITHSFNFEYKCTPLSPQTSNNNAICGCISSEQTSVIIIIDASGHTKLEWQHLTLKWLSLYYDSIYNSEYSHHMQVYYMLSHGDFTLTSLNSDPLLSDLSTDSFMDSLSELSQPNACVAFKRANQWISNNNIEINNTAIIYYAKTTPFAPGFPYHCRDENQQQYKLIHSNKDIFAIKYYDYINLNYVQRDIGEFAYKMSIFPNTYNNILIDGQNNNYLIGANNRTDEIAAYIVAAISDFVCTKASQQILDQETHETEDNNNEHNGIIVVERNRNIIERESDCCTHASGIEYHEINTCDLYKIQEIEYLLDTQKCLFYCNPFHFYVETNQRNWDCITNYALWVQLYHICNDLHIEYPTINLTMWNDYRWHCPICYNISVDEYKSVCRSNDGKQQLLNTYISENCNCKDVTLFLVVIIEITALLCILIGMFILWYRFNVIKVKQHLREKQFIAINQPNHPEEVILNDMNENIDSD